MNRKALSVAVTLMLLAIVISGIFIAPAYAGSNSRKRVLIRNMGFTFENTWGTYKASAYHNVLNKKPSPTVIVVHGLGANKDMYMWIVDALTKSGFVVVTFTVPQGIVDQLLSGEGGLENLLSLFSGGGMEGFFEEMLTNIPFGQWPDGIISCIDKMTTDVELKKIVDGKKIFVIGHSAGGLGALVAANQDTRIKGVVALAPPVIEDAQEWSGTPPTSLNVPVQLQVGTKDSLYEAVVAYYAELNTNGYTKELVTIEGGDHIQFMDQWIVSLIRAMSNFVEIPFIGESAAEISVEEQHRQSSKAFLNFLSHYK